MRDAVVVCLNSPSGRGLEDAGWMGRALHARRMR